MVKTRPLQNNHILKNKHGAADNPLPTLLRCWQWQTIN